MASVLQSVKPPLHADFSLLDSDINAHIITKIFSMVTAQDLYRFSRVCRRWQMIVLKSGIYESLWRLYTLWEKKGAESSSIEKASRAKRKLNIALKSQLYAARRLDSFLFQSRTLRLEHQHKGFQAYLTLTRLNIVSWGKIDELIRQISFVVDRDVTYYWRLVVVERLDQGYGIEARKLFDEYVPNGGVHYLAIIRKMVRFYCLHEDFMEGLNFYKKNKKYLLNQWFIAIESLSSGKEETNKAIIQSVSKEICFCGAARTFVRLVNTDEMLNQLLLQIAGWQDPQYASLIKALLQRKEVYPETILKLIKFFGEKQGFPEFVIKKWDFRGVRENYAFIKEFSKLGVGEGIIFAILDKVSWIHEIDLEEALVEKIFTFNVLISLVNKCPNITSRHLVKALEASHEKKLVMALLKTFDSLYFEADERVAEILQLASDYEKSVQKAIKSKLPKEKECSLM